MAAVVLSLWQFFAIVSEEEVAIRKNDEKKGNEAKTKTAMAYVLYNKARAAAAANAMMKASESRRRKEKKHFVDRMSESLYLSSSIAFISLSCLEHSSKSTPRPALARMQQKLAHV